MLKKSFAIVLSAILLTLSLCACSGGISRDEAKNYINGFLERIEAEDYKSAEELLHPERPGNLKEFFEAAENEKGVDFSNITIKKYTGFKSAMYDSTVGGSTYALKMDLNVSNQTVEMEVEIVKNDNGYGIYNLDLDFD